MLSANVADCSSVIGPPTSGNLKSSIENQAVGGRSVRESLQEGAVRTWEAGAMDKTPRKGGRNVIRGRSG